MLWCLLSQEAGSVQVGVGLCSVSAWGLGHFWVPVLMSVSIPISLTVGSENCLWQHRFPGHRELSQSRIEEQLDLCVLELWMGKVWRTEATSRSLSLLPYSASSSELRLALHRPMKLPVGARAVTPVWFGMPFHWRGHFCLEQRLFLKKPTSQCDWGRENSHQQVLLQVLRWWVCLCFLTCSMIWEVLKLHSAHCSANSASGRRSRNSGGRQTWLQSHLLLAMWPRTSLLTSLSLMPSPVNPG